MGPVRCGMTSSRAGDSVYYRDEGLLMAHSRRPWMKTAAMGLGGLLARERNLAAQPVNHACALADPRDEIKITGLEIIPVNSLRSIFVKMHTDAGITGIGEGTVEGP